MNAGEIDERQMLSYFGIHRPKYRRCPRETVEHFACLLKATMHSAFSTLVMPFYFEVIIYAKAIHLAAFACLVGLFRREQGRLAPRDRPFLRRLYRRLFGELS